MKRAGLILLIVLMQCSFALSAFAVEIASVYPDVAFAGSPVTIIGGPFGDAVVVDLAGRQIPARRVSSRQLVFLVPELSVGEYALFLRDGKTVSRQTFSLRIELPPPVISSLSPQSLDECALPENRQVVIRGENIQNHAQLLFAGAVVPFEREDGASLSFVPPASSAGSYGVQIVNPDGKRSLPHNLKINNQPEIESVSAGNDFVNYYQVVISGKNFSPSSILLIKEYPGGFADLPPRQRFIPNQGNAESRGAGGNRGFSGNVVFQDCNTLIYNRYPAVNQDMRIVFQVSNPDGSQSAPYEASLP